MRRVVSAGAVIFRRPPDGQVKFLLLYYGRGYWNFPKGKVEEGEQPTSAFLREVEEETGLRATDLRILSGFRTTERYTFVDRYVERARSVDRTEPRPKVFKLVIYYLVEARKREVTISDEHEGFGWFTYAESLSIAKYPNTRNILKQAHDFIRKGLRRNAGHPARQSRHLR